MTSALFLQWENQSTTEWIYELSHFDIDSIWGVCFSGRGGERRRRISICKDVTGSPQPRLHFVRVGDMPTISRLDSDSDSDSNTPDRCRRRK